MKSKVWDVTFDNGKRFKVVARTAEEAIKRGRELLSPEMLRDAEVISINVVCELDLT